MAGEFGISMLTERLMPGVHQAQVDKLTAQRQEKADQASGGVSFQETLKGALGEVNEALQTADKASQDFASGKATNLHDVMIAMEKADVQLRTLTSVRNKAVEAYQEILRMQV